MANFAQWRNLATSIINSIATCRAVVDSLAFVAQFARLVFARIDPCLRDIRSYARLTRALGTAAQLV